jgi:hypothetical protein
MMMSTASVVARKLLSPQSLGKGRPSMIRLLSKSTTLAAPEFSDHCDLNIVSRFVM